MTVIEPPLSTPVMRPARLRDYDEIRRLGLAFSLDVPPEEDWRRLWLDNPLRDRFGDDLPLGWVLETAEGEMVGTMGTVLVPYLCRREPLVSAVSRAWFVATPYRTFALQLMDEYINQPRVDLCINSAVSVPALEAFRQFCEPVPLGQWDCMSYWITGHQGFAYRRLLESGVPLPRLLSYTAGATSWVKSAMRGRRWPKISNVNIELTDRFDNRFDVFWNELARQSPHSLLADRSSRTLAWHFGAPMRHGALWVFTASRGGRLMAYCVLTRQDNAFRLPAPPHEDRQGIKCARLADYQCLDPESDALPDLLGAALERCSRDGVYVLENLGRGVPKMRFLDDRAPFCERLSNWKFYYTAREPQLRAALREPRMWDPSAYDGDASFE